MKRPHKRYCLPGGNIIRNIRETCWHVVALLVRAKTMNASSEGEASEMFHYVFVATMLLLLYGGRCKITRGVRISFLPISRSLSICPYRDEIRTILLGERDTRRHGPLPSCYLPEATRKKVTGERWIDRDREMRWIKNEDKSVFPRYSWRSEGGTAGENAEKFGRDARRFAGTIDHFAGTHDPQDNPGP